MSQFCASRSIPIAVQLLEGGINAFTSLQIEKEMIGAVACGVMDSSYPVINPLLLLVIPTAQCQSISEPDCIRFLVWLGGATFENYNSSFSRIQLSPDIKDIEIGVCESSNLLQGCYCFWQLIAKNS